MLAWIGGIVIILAGMVIVFITWPTVSNNQSTLGQICLALTDASGKAEAMRSLQAFYAGIAAFVVGILLFALGFSVTEKD